MKVSEIIARKAGDVETVGPEVSVREAARKLAELNIGSLVVTDCRGRVLSVLTERDIARGVAERGAEAAQLPVDALASRALVCTPDVEVDQAKRVMTDNRARHLVVMVGDRLESVVSLGDIVHARLDLCQLEVSVLRDYSRARGRPASLAR